MSLQGKIAYVAGGTGIVGSGIAEALLKAGAKVWISSRDETKINEFKLSLPEKLRDKLSGIKGEVTVENDIVRIRDTILKQDAKIDHVISSLGGWWQKGVLSDQSIEEYNSVIADMVTSHFFVYKTFAKELAKQPGSTYTFISGGSGEMCEQDDFTFYPDASLIPLGSAGVYGLYNGAKSEFKDHANLRISQLRISVWVRRQADSSFDPTKASHEVGTDFIGRFIVKIAENHRGGLLRVKSRGEGEIEYKKI